MTRIRAAAAAFLLAVAAGVDAGAASTDADFGDVTRALLCFEDASRVRRCTSDFPGRVLIVNFWATWCVPCIRELPMLDGLHARLQHRGVTVLAVAADRRGAAAVRQMRERLGIAHLDFYLDAESKTLAAIGARGLPHTLVIDPTGRIRYRYSGAIPVPEADLARIALSLAEPAPQKPRVTQETER